MQNETKPYGYTGEGYGGYIHLLHLRARWYSPGEGVFLSRDAVESEPAYQYVRGNPVNWVDPSGHFPPDNRPQYSSELIDGGGGNLSVEKPHIVSRSEWGALEPGTHYICGPLPLLGFGPPTCTAYGWYEGFYDPVNNPGGYAYYSDLRPNESLADILDTVVIHHSGNSPISGIGAIQTKHMRKDGLVDIAYHFVVDPPGIIYEGRDIRVRGANVEYGNSGKVGVLLLGDFEPGPEINICGITIWADKDDRPTQQQVQSTLALIRWLDYMYGIDKVVGHRDAQESFTECPGEYCLPYIRIFNDAAQER